MELPIIVGIVNVTPDSFSDGGRLVDARAAVDAGLRLMDEGAEWIDVGGESTRPGAFRVYEGEELRRTIPVVEALSARGVRVSIDTRKPEVARQAIAAGAQMVNDVTGLTDPTMCEVCAKSGVKVCIMHMQGNPRTMQDQPQYQDVVAEVKEFLLGQAALAEASGVRRENILIDPGFGFGKTLDHNLALLRATATFADLGFPLYVGISRKRMFAAMLESDDFDRRIAPAVALQVQLWRKGARYLRTHDVQVLVDAVRVDREVWG